MVEEQVAVWRHSWKILPGGVLLFVILLMLGRAGYKETPNASEATATTTTVSPSAMPQPVVTPSPSPPATSSTADNTDSLAPRAESIDAIIEKAKAALKWTSTLKELRDARAELLQIPQGHRRYAEIQNLLPRFDEYIKVNAQHDARGATDNTLTAAQKRLAAAAELQRAFDASLVKNMEIKFHVLGDNCGVLNVEGSNLYQTMMSGIAQGTGMYGSVVSGGVNSFAFGRGFRDVVYTNRDDTVFAAFGPDNLTRAQTVKLRPCNNETARRAEVGTASPAPISSPVTPVGRLVSSSGRIDIGTRLYEHGVPVATVLAIANKDPDTGARTPMVLLKFDRSSAPEWKTRDVVKRFFQVRDSD